MLKSFWPMRWIKSMINPLYIVEDGPGGAPDSGVGPADTIIPNGEDPSPGESSPPSGGKPPTWYQGLPEGMHEKVKDMSAEDAAKVFERGSSYQPVESADFDLEMPEGSMIPEPYVAGFKEFAAEHKMTSEQAKAFVNWYEQKDVEAFNASVEAGKTQLKNVFKESYDSKLNDAQETIAILDKQMGGRLSEGVKNGLHSNPAFLEAMAVLRPSFKEADVSGGNGSGGEVKAEDPKDFYGKFYEKEN